MFKPTKEDLERPVKVKDLIEFKDELGDFIVETVGEKSVDTTIGIYLDTLARYLYQEKKRLNL